MIYDLREISDHHLFNIKLLISKDVKRTLPFKKSEFWHTADIKSTLHKLKSILSDSDSLSQPMRNLIKDKVPTRVKIHHFWQPMPEWWNNN